MAKFTNIIFDFDSTLVTIEGLDVLAKRKGILEEVEQITNSGMNGRMPFSRSLRLRWEIIQPNVNDIKFLVKAYQKAIVQDAKKIIEKFISKKVNVFVATGGIKEAVIPVVKKIGVPESNVFAVCTKAHGGVLNLDEKCLMATDVGKTVVVDLIKKTGPTIVVGDGMTDFIAGKHADLFIGFGGVVERDSVKNLSEHYIKEASLLKVLEYIK